MVWASVKIVVWSFSNLRRYLGYYKLWTCAESCQYISLQTNIAAKTMFLQENLGLVVMLCIKMAKLNGFIVGCDRSGVTILQWQSFCTSFTTHNVSLFCNDNHFVQVPIMLINKWCLYIIVFRCVFYIVISYEENNLVWKIKECVSLESHK